MPRSEATPCRRPARSRAIAAGAMSTAVTASPCAASQSALRPSPAATSSTGPAAESATFAHQERLRTGDRPSRSRQRASQWAESAALTASASLQPRLELGQRHGARRRASLAPAPEQDQGRDAADGVAGGHLGHGVGVELGDPQAGLELLRRLRRAPAPSPCTARTRSPRSRPAAAPRPRAGAGRSCALVSSIGRP